MSSGVSNQYARLDDGDYFYDFSMRCVIEATVVTEKERDAFGWGEGYVFVLRGAPMAQPGEYYSVPDYGAVLQCSCVVGGQNVNPFKQRSMAKELGINILGDKK